MPARTTTAPARLLALWAGVFCIALLASACERAAAWKPATLAEFERATRDMSRTETAKYVFTTYGCDACHTIDDKGNTGFTARGEDARKGFTGCVRLLTTVNASVPIPEAERSPEERRVHATFNEYGCGFCHKVEPGRISFTEIGRKLAFLHLGCVEVQEELKKRAGT